MKITVVGAGAVGASCAEYIAIKDFVSEVVLLDIKEGFAEGKAMDLMQTASLNSFDTNIVGSTNDYSKTADSDICVITSGIPRKPGMSREELIGINAGIVKTVSSSLLEHSPDTILIVVSNPMDSMTYLVHKTTSIPKNRIIGNFLDWVKAEDAADEHTQHAAVDAFIDTEILRLIGTRNHWMYEAKQEMSYHGSQNSLWRKEGNIRVADDIREVAGLKTLLAEGEPEEAGSKGELEYFQRSSLVGAHPGGTIEVQKVIIARRIGVSRTKERAAPTPSTAKITS